jgi:hypothetical protein
VDCSLIPFFEVIAVFIVQEAVQLCRGQTGLYTDLEWNDDDLSTEIQFSECFTEKPAAVELSLIGKPVQRRVTAAHPSHSSSRSSELAASSAHAH